MAPFSCASPARASSNAVWKRGGNVLGGVGTANAADGADREEGEGQVGEGGASASAKEGEVELEGEGEEGRPPWLCGRDGVRLALCEGEGVDWWLACVSGEDSDCDGVLGKGSGLATASKAAGDGDDTATSASDTWEDDDASDCDMTRQVRATREC